MNGIEITVEIKPEGGERQFLRIATPERTGAFRAMLLQMIDRQIKLLEAQREAIQLGSIPDEARVG